MQTPAFSPTRYILGAIAAIIMVFAQTSRAGPPGEIWVGAGPTCDFATLQEAFDSMPTDGTQTLVRVADDQPYVDQALAIEDHTFHLIGGFADCEGTEYNGRTVIAGNGLDPVVRIANSAGTYYARFTRVDITGGNGTQGGGLSIGAHAYVSMTNTRIYGNSAVSGGGISIDGTEAPSTLDIGIGSRIGSIDAPNTATDGAGVYCVGGSVRLSRSTVSYNIASGNGGGFYLDGCSLEAYGAQPGADGNHLDYNEADAGGAIFAHHASEIRLGTNSGRTDFLGNYAATTGGAFHLIGEDTLAVMTASRFESNAAGERGGSLYVADDALFRMERGHTEPLLCPEFPCSALLSSRAGIEGSVAIARANARLEIHESVIADDGTGPAVPAIVAVGSDTLLLANNILMHGMSGEGVVLGDGAMGVVQFATFTDNAFSSDLRLGAGTTTLYVQYSIFWDAPASVLVGGASGVNVSDYCNNVHENGSLPGVTDDPRFVDAAAQNYRLRGDSPDVDACAYLKTSQGIDGTFLLILDVDGGFRPIDLYPSNGDGPYDRGAHELQDPVFANGFE
jgi:hypothetical protein